jgi:hypothetical protein
MRKFTWIVLTNCDPMHEDEYNRWYDDIHIPDLLRIPGIVGASRSRLADVQMPMAPDNSLMLSDSKTVATKYRYMACYYIETDDVAAVLNEVTVRSNTPDMIISPFMAGAYTLMFEDISPTGQGLRPSP